MLEFCMEPTDHEEIWFLGRGSTPNTLTPSIIMLHTVWKKSFDYLLKWRFWNELWISANEDSNFRNILRRRNFLAVYCFFLND